MAKKNFTPEQIIKKLREAEVLQSKGETVAQVISKEDLMEEIKRLRSIQLKER